MNIGIIDFVTIIKKGERLFFRFSLLSLTRKLGDISWFLFFLELNDYDDKRFRSGGPRYLEVKVFRWSKKFYFSKKPGFQGRRRGSAYLVRNPAAALEKAEKFKSFWREILRTTGGKGNDVKRP